MDLLQRQLPGVRSRQEETPGRRGCQTQARALQGTQIDVGPHACRFAYCAAPRGGAFCLEAARRQNPIMTDEEVLAQTRRWLEKAVIGLNLCPFAKAVYVKNQVRLVVSHARHADDLLEELDRELDLLVATPAEEIDTTLLIHPTLFEDFLDFNDFLEIAEGVVDEHGLEGVVQLASFHPQFQFDGTAPDDISNYTNRAPFAI